ncbi:methanesulfonate monooxygenase protein [Rutstroemia sp. NJR-2017a WRK4]|nr:methanesulfonate monooxygenase protein [Rutstroemia sp. NJR-2017a WRK4]
MTTTITISSDSPLVIRHSEGHTNGFINGQSSDHVNGHTPGNSRDYTNGILTNGHNSRFSAAPDVNDAPDRVKFAYWVPNVSGGLVISKIPQRTDASMLKQNSWDYKSNVRYAQTAEEVGFEYALTQIRFMAGYGAENQHESVSFSQALLHSTKKLNVIAALLPGPWNPAIAAKQIASIDQYTDGRISVNVVSGWFKAEFTSIGQWWLEHAERYRRSKEFIECLKGIWTSPKFSYRGDFYQFHDYPLSPKPLKLPGRPHPLIFQGGNSIDARDNGAQVSDYYFMNGNTLEGFQEQIADVKERARKFGREDQIRFAVNGFAIVRDTEWEAIQLLSEIQGKADKEAVAAFSDAVKQAGSSTSNKKGMWADSKFEDLVQYNDGFKTKLIGTAEQVADRILLLKSLGIDIVLLAFLHYDDDIQDFGEKVLPLVRKLEKEGRGKDAEDEIRRTGDVYRAKPPAREA